MKRTAKACLVLWTAIFLSASVSWAAPEVTTNKKAAPAPWVKTSANQTTTINELKYKAPIPSVQVTPETIHNADPIGGGTSGVVDNRPANVAPDTHDMCPQGYWCQAQHSGYLPTCLLGTAPSHDLSSTISLWNIEGWANALRQFSDPRDCSQVARFCLSFPNNIPNDQKGPVFQSYCTS